MTVHLPAPTATTPLTPVTVTVKVHRVEEGSGTRPEARTAGPTAVTTTRPPGTAIRTVSPSIPSAGWSALAVSTRPTATVGVGSHDGREP